MATPCGILFVLCVLLVTVTCDICFNNDIILSSLDIQKRIRKEVSNIISTLHMQPDGSIITKQNSNSNFTPLLANNGKIISWNGRVNNEHEINSNFAHNLASKGRFNTFPIYPRQPYIQTNAVITPGFSTMNNFDKKIFPGLKQEIKNPNLYYWQPRIVDLTSRYQPLWNPKTNRWIERNSDQYNLPPAFAHGTLLNFKSFPYFNQNILEQNIDRNNVIRNPPVNHNLNGSPFLTISGSSQLLRDKMVTNIDGLVKKNMKITQEITPTMQSASENKIHSLFDLIKQSPVTKSIDKNAVAIKKHFRKNMDDTNKDNVDENGNKHEASVLNTTIANSTTGKPSSFSDVMNHSSTTKHENSKDSGILNKAQDDVGLTKFESDDVVVQAIENLIQTIPGELANKGGLYSRQNEKSTDETKIVKLDFNPENKAIDLMEES